MNFPSLNLGRYASALDDRILASAVHTVGGRLSRAARSSVGPAARFAGKAALVGGASMLGLGAAAATTAVGLGYGAASLYKRALSAPTFRPDMLGFPEMQQGGRMITWQKHGRIPLTNRHMWTPMASHRFADMAGTVGIAAGVAGGANDYRNSKNWTVTQALHTGSIEVERDNFLGATGSLTLSMYRQRHGRPAPQEMNEGGVMGAAMRMNKTEMVHALHMAHMAYGG